jgi:hypothetical protein
MAVLASSDRRYISLLPRGWMICPQSVEDRPSRIDPSFLLPDSAARGLRAFLLPERPGVMTTLMQDQGGHFALIVADEFNFGIDFGEEKSGSRFRE